MITTAISGRRNREWLRLSLVLVWLGTALVSVIEMQGQSAQLLHTAGINAPWLVSTLIWSGIAVDLVLGLALWRCPTPWVHHVALAMMLLMTLLATVLQPGLWLHPLGPLLKNLPIAALLWVLARDRT